MNVQTGIGASILRKEDRRFITGSGNYVADIKRRTWRWAYSCARRTRTHVIKSIDTGGRDGAAGRRRDASPATDLKPTASAACPAHGASRQRDGTPMKEPPHPALAAGQGAMRRRRGRVRDRRHAASRRSEAADAIEVDYEVLPAVVGMLDAIKPGAAAVYRGHPRQYLLRVGRRRRRATEAAFKKPRMSRKHQPRQQPPGRQSDGAARGIGEYEPATRPVHDVDHEPVPAHREAADGQLRAQHPAAQTARRCARRRRRLRREAIPLRRGDASSPGRRARSAVR